MDEPSRCVACGGAVSPDSLVYCAFHHRLGWWEEEEPRHYYPDGGWRRPWLCLDCHPHWFYGSVILVGLVLTAIWLVPLLLVSRG